MHLRRSAIAYAIITASGSCVPRWSPRLCALFEGLIERAAALPPEDPETALANLLRHMLVEVHEISALWLDRQFWQRERLSDLFSHGTIASRLEPIGVLLEQGISFLTTEDEQEANALLFIMPRTQLVVAAAQIDFTIARELKKHKIRNPETSAAAGSGVTMTV